MDASAFLILISLRPFQGPPSPFFLYILHLCIILILLPAHFSLRDAVGMASAELSLLKGVQRLRNSKICE